MLPGRDLATRFIRQDEVEILRENEWLKRFAVVRAAKHSSDLRRHQRFVALSGPTSRARASRSCHIEHVQGSAQRESVRRLEPERRTQNHHLRLFTPCERRTDCFHACEME